MAAYVIFAREKVLDPKEMELYVKKAPSRALQHRLKGGEYRCVVVEGI